MKILKWLLYIVLSLIALVLLIPLFLPATVEVIAESEASVSPAQVFYNAASYTDRNVWDPWLETEPDAAYTITPQEGYIGSEYTWSGDKIKSGRMVVDSVVFGKYIASLIYFGDDPDPGKVEWLLKESEKGTIITWSFVAETSYPIERLMLNLFKGQMKANFEKGLGSLCSYLDENPPVLSSLGEISRDWVPGMHVLLMEASGTMDQYGEQMGEMFPMLYQEVESQGLQISGAAFSHYVSFDHETGITNYFCGVQVNKNGEDNGRIMAQTYKEFPVIQAIHTGPYEGLGESYTELMAYLETNEIEATMEALEFYLIGPMMEPDVTKMQTLIAMPVK